MIIGIISDTHGLPREEVKGNCDKTIDTSIAPESKIINVEGTRIYLIHYIGKIDIDLEKENIDIIIYGHSHKGNILEKDGILYINPGSVGPRRFKLPTTMARLTIDGNKNYKAKLITLIN